MGFVRSHPGGPQVFELWAGKDATAAFREQHSEDTPTGANYQEMVDAYGLRVGKFQKVTKKKKKAKLTRKEVAKHNTKGDKWVVIDGNVLDISNIFIGRLGDAMPNQA